MSVPGSVRVVCGAFLLLGAMIVAAAASRGKAPAGKKQAFLEGTERQAFLAGVEKQMSGVRSLAARFTQEKNLKVFKSTVRSSGILLFAAPDRLRWEIQKPFRSILVVAGDQVGKFEYVDGKRRSLRLRGGRQAIVMVMSQIRSWFRGKFDPDGEYYDVRVSAAPTPLVVLRPKIEALRKNLTEIKLELTEDLSAVAAVTILEKAGDSTVMRFRELRRDAAFPAGLFSVSDPSECNQKLIEDAAAIRKPETR